MWLPNGIPGLKICDRFSAPVAYKGKQELAWSWKHYEMAKDPATYRERCLDNLIQQVEEDFWVSAINKDYQLMHTISKPHSSISIVCRITIDGKKALGLLQEGLFTTRPKKHRQHDIWGTGVGCSGLLQNCFKNKEQVGQRLVGLILLWISIWR